MNYDTWLSTDKSEKNADDFNDDDSLLSEPNRCRYCGANLEYDGDDVYGFCCTDAAYLYGFFCPDGHI